MDEQPIISFRNVSKKFTFSGKQADSVLQSLINTFSRDKRLREQQTLWALKNVDFDIFPAQSLGIIGNNGSGKSTALKMIARIIQPTEGEITVNGRLSALLELGVGFHAELTGRENVYLNASFIGLTKQDVDEIYDDVIEFADIGEFIDLPVKFYSSGMYVRLGFSVAIHVVPDILIIDEVLTVGDHAFQTKCLQRIYDMRRQGTTIIMVSHSLDQLRKICSHVLWLEKGEIIAHGETDEVVEAYRAASSHKNKFANSDLDFKRYGSGEIELTAVRLLNSAGEEKVNFRTGDAVTIEMAYTAHEPIHEPEFGLAIFHEDGTQINGPNTDLGGLKLGTVPAGSGIVRYQIDSLPLLPAQYFLTAAIHDHHVAKAFDYHHQGYSFQVQPGNTREFHGIFHIPSNWSIEPSNSK